ncbi:MAG: HNH endonuclease family protein [Bifidobacteriaceae bacterium]|jgi:hypothetical protein|nr:HNH endonuclease family protein [Bifidobacteriaceae bacterium]
MRHGKGSAFGLGNQGHGFEWPGGQKPSGQNLAGKKMIIREEAVPANIGQLPDLGTGGQTQFWSPNGPADIRDQILALHLDDVEFGLDGMLVKHGWLDEHYTGARVEFTRSNWPDPKAIELDHVVSREDAWISGAWEWGVDSVKWLRFFNDWENIIPTLAWANRDKAGKNAAEWLPPDKRYWPRFVTVQVTTKLKYGLSFTEAERAAIRSVMEDAFPGKPPRETP